MKRKHFSFHWAKQWYWAKRFWALSFESGIGSKDGRFYIGSVVLADRGLILGWSVGTGFGGKCYSLANNEVRDFWQFGQLIADQDLEGAIDE